MQKEQWINEIMESAAQIKQAEPNPYLFNKIQVAIDQPKEKIAPVFKWTLAASLIVVMNIGCIFYVSFNKKQQSNEEAIASLSSEMGFNSNYNY
jgi:hypothetical protein